MNCDVRKLRCASLRSVLQRCDALRLGPIQKWTQGEFLQFFFPSPHEAAVFPSAIVVPKTRVFFHSNELLSPKVLDLEMVASVVKTLL